MARPYPNRTMPGTWAAASSALGEQGVQSFFLQGVSFTLPKLQTINCGGFLTARVRWVHSVRGHLWPYGTLQSIGSMRCAHAERLVERRFDARGDVGNRMCAVRLNGLQAIEKEWCTAQRRCRPGTGRPLDD